MTFLLTLLILLLCFAGMAIGVLLSRKPLQKRCGVDPTTDCTCGTPSEIDCPNKNAPHPNAGH